MRRTSKIVHQQLINLHISIVSTQFKQTIQRVNKQSCQLIHSPRWGPMRACATKVIQEKLDRRTEQGGTAIYTRSVDVSF